MAKKEEEGRTKKPNEEEGRRRNMKGEGRNTKG